jgi:hypothetical protein
VTAIDALAGTPALHRPKIDYLAPALDVQRAAIEWSLRGHSI